MRKGTHHKLESRKKLSISTTGRRAWNKGIPFSAESRKKMSDSAKKKKLSSEHKRKIGESLSGEKHWNWKGGVSPRSTKTVKYEKWRRAVFERDDFTCQFCFKRGGELNADHIKPWALFPKLRFVLGNGRTLCVKCHRTTFVFMGNQFSKICPKKKKT